MTDQVIERAVAKFIELRDKKKVLTDEHKLILAPYNEAMTKIENLVHASNLRVCNDTESGVPLSLQSTD